MLGRPPPARAPCCASVGGARGGLPVLSARRARMRGPSWWTWGLPTSCGIMRGSTWWTMSLGPGLRRWARGMKSWMTSSAPMARWTTMWLAWPWMQRMRWRQWGAVSSLYINHWTWALDIRHSGSWASQKLALDSKKKGTAARHRALRNYSHRARGTTVPRNRCQSGMLCATHNLRPALPPRPGAP